MMKVLNNRKIRIFDIIICVFLFAAIIAGLILPKTGRFALAGEICDVIAIWAVVILVIVRTAAWRGEASATGKVVRIVVIVLLLAVGIWFTKEVALDIVNGPEITVLSDLQMSRTQAHTGIFSNHCYLTGTDRSGERMRFEISENDYTEISGCDTVRIEYYRYTRRIVCFM